MLYTEGRVNFSNFSLWSSWMYWVWRDRRSEGKVMYDVLQMYFVHVL